MNNYVITVARETGSAGLQVTRRLSKELNIPFYDRDLLRLASEVSGITVQRFKEADEQIGVKEMMSAAEKVYTGEVLPPDSDDFISSRNLFSFQAKVIRELADQESCIILGRCANYLLRNHPNVLRVFIRAPQSVREGHIAEVHTEWSFQEVADYLKAEDKRRADYYHYYTGEEWRDVSGYDLVLDFDKLGEAGCATAIQQMLPFFCK